MRSSLWLLFAAADVALLAGLGLWFDIPLLYALAPLSFPAWAWMDGRPEVRALLNRRFGDR